MRLERWVLTIVYIFSVLQASPVTWILCCGGLGLILGSFLSVVSHRLPQMMQQRWHSDCRELLELPAGEPPQRYNLTWPRSHCPQCHHKLHVWENIPLFSYLWLRGRCSQCTTRIPLRYPLLELSTGIALAHLAWNLGYTWQVLPAIIFI